MLRKFLIFGLLIMVLSLTACTSADGAWETEASYADEEQTMVKIPSEPNKVYDIETKVVYFMIYESGVSMGYGFMSPYLSENGKYCRYEDGQIVEIPE